MNGSTGDVEPIFEAVGRVQHVRSVPVIRLAHEDGTGRVVAVIRVGLPSALVMTEIDTVIAHVQLTAARLLPQGAAVHVEPAVAADQGTPTESIVIRALE